MMLRMMSGPNGLMFDSQLGNIPDLWFGGITPLHKAPWYGSADDLTAIPAVDRRLAGDFFCMPFGKSDAVEDPQHGHSANAPWEVVERQRDALKVTLTVPVMGATLTKEIRIAHDAPLLYQTHEITGGEGAVTFAHHPMVRMVAGGRLAFSRKRAALTPESPLEPGANIFPPGVTGTDPAAMPGGFDLTQYPKAAGEDFVTLVEAERSTFGWTAVTRAAENDIVFVLKDPRVQPVTMLWFSNGGRKQAPWFGRHRGVLGIEDGVAPGLAGHRAALSANPVRELGVPTAIELGGRHVIRHVIGAIPKPQGWQTVTRIHREAGSLVITGDTGETVSMVFAAGFL